MRRVAEGTPAPVDERGAHAVGLRADAVERVVGDEEHARAVDPEPLAGLRVGRVVRLEVAGLVDRDHRVEVEPDVRPGRLEHVAVAVRENREAITPVQPFERRQHVGERLQPLDAGDEPAHLVVGMVDAGAAHDVRHRAVSDLAVGRVAAVAQRVDHRVFEVRPPPPGDEAVRVAAPALAGQERRHHLGQTALHVDDGAVLVEHQGRDLAAQETGQIGAHRMLLLRKHRRGRGGHAPDFFGASNTAATSMTSPSRDLDVAESPAAKTPCSTYAPPSSVSTVIVSSRGSTIQYSGMPASA